MLHLALVAVVLETRAEWTRRVPSSLRRLPLPARQVREADHVVGAGPGSSISSYH